MRNYDSIISLTVTKEKVTTNNVLLAQVNLTVYNRLRQT
jgi:hypothetical protein